MKAKSTPKKAATPTVSAPPGVAKKVDVGSIGGSAVNGDPPKVLENEVRYFSISYF